MALMAVGASAQEKFLVGADTDLASYQGVDYKATASVKLFCGENASGWNAVSPLKGDEDHAFDEFTHYTSGKDNPVSGEKTKYSLSNHTVPDKGAYYILKPSAAGSLQVGIILNGGKDFYVVDGEGVALSDFDLKNEEGKVVALSADCKTDEKFYGILTFNVEAGKSYYVFCNGSKLGFAGFKFNTTAATIDAATTAACKEKIDAANPNAQGGGGTSTVADGTYFISFDGLSAGNKVTTDNGFTLQITGNEAKEYSAASKITIDGTEYTTIKLSNGAQNTLTLPAGKIATGITFYSYVNKDAATERASYWKEVGGTEYTETPNGGNFKSYKDTENPDVCTYSFGENKLNVITFTNTGEQCCFVIKIAIAAGTATGINAINAATIDANAPAYNLAGQKVDSSFKGIIIKNGKKMIQK